MKKSAANILDTLPVRNAGMKRQFLSVVEAEEVTGISRWTWRRWAYAGRCESVKCSTRLLLPVAEIERIMAESTRPRAVEVA
jgi:predicted site-specific integrase-resolvase